MTRRRSIAAVLLAVVAAGLAIALVVVTRGQRLHRDDAMVVAANQEAVAFFSLAPGTIDADLARVQQLATGGFATSYAKQAPTIKTAITKAGLTTTATVPTGGSAVEQESRSSGSVLVAVNSETTTAKGASESNDYRMRVTLVRVHGRWLVSDIERVG